MTFETTTDGPQQGLRSRRTSGSSHTTSVSHRLVALRPVAVDPDPSRDSLRGLAVAAAAMTAGTVVYDVVAQPGEPDRIRFEVEARFPARTPPSVVQRDVAYLRRALLLMEHRAHFEPSFDDRPSLCAHAEITLRRRLRAVPMNREPSPVGFERALRAHAAGRAWSLAGPFICAASPDALADLLAEQPQAVRVRVEMHRFSLSSEQRDCIERGAVEMRNDCGGHEVVRRGLASVDAILDEERLLRVRWTVAAANEVPLDVAIALLDRLGLESGAHGSVAGHVLGDGPLATATPPQWLDLLRELYTPGDAASLLWLPRGTERERFTLPIDRVRHRPAPPMATSGDGSILGYGVQRGEPVPIRSSDEDRFRHVYVTGQTGVGKSTFLESLILQDIERGWGTIVFDQHGDLYDRVAARIPACRRSDVVCIDPTDPEAVVGLNLLEAESTQQTEYLVSELAEMMYLLFDPNRQGIVGPRFEALMRNGALTLLADHANPSTFLDIPSLFVNHRLRACKLELVTDPYVLEFWREEFDRTSDYHRSEIMGWFRSKWEPFRTSLPIRRLLGQARSTVSFTDLLRDRRIVLVNLAKGRLGHYNCKLIGFVVLTKLWAAMLERGSLPAHERHAFSVFIDEFQAFSTSTLPSMLSEARKFGVSIVLANQFFGQVNDDVRLAIAGNVGTKVAFRVGPGDSSMLADWLGGGVTAQELRELPNHTALASLTTGGIPLEPFTIRAAPPPDLRDPAKAAATIRHSSRANWSVPVDRIDREIRDRWSLFEALRTMPTSTTARA